MPTKGYPSLKTIRTLALASGGECYFPHCTTRLYDASQGVGIGEVAHICSPVPNGPRHDPNLTRPEVHRFDNLLFLCKPDHDLIDKHRVDEYPATELRRIKLEHESKAKDSAERRSPDAMAGVVAAALESLEATKAEQALAWYLAWELESSIGRCEQLVAGLGVDSEIAKDMAEDTQLGLFEPDGLQRIQAAEVILLRGPMGSGKSLLLNRLFQTDLEYLLDAGDIDAPIPVYLVASAVAGSSLREVVESTLARAAVNWSNVTVRCYLDALDEADPRQASRLAAEANGLHATGRFEVVATSRLASGEFRPDQTFDVPELTPSEALDLIGRISGRSLPSVYQLPRAIQDSVRRPAFAILFGVAMKQNPMAAYSNQWGMVQDVVLWTLGREYEAADAAGAELLRRLAAHWIRLGEFPRLIELAASHDQRVRLLRTRLVVDRGGRVEFAVPLLARWFAAEALRMGEVSVASLEPDWFEQARLYDPLCIAFEQMTADEADEQFANVVVSHPSLAARIASEWHWNTELDSSGMPPDVTRLGERLREATFAWIAAFRPVSDRFSTLGASTTASLAINATGAGVTTAWDTQTGSPPVRFEPSGSDFRLRRRWFSWRPWRSGWRFRWEWSIDQVKSEAQWLLTNLCTASPSRLPAEYWFGAAKAIGSRPGHGGPIDIEHLVTQIDGTLSRADEGWSISFGLGPSAPAFTPAELRSWRNRLRLDLERGRTSLAEPYPAADVPTVPAGGKTRWVWEAYSDEALLGRVTEVYGAALGAYRQVASELFSSMRLPPPGFVRRQGKLVGVLSRDPDSQRGCHTLYWHIPGTDARSSPLFVLRHETHRTFGPGGDTSEFAQLLSVDEPTLNDLPWTMSGLSEVWGEKPALELYSKWLKDDFRELGLSR